MVASTRLIVIGIDGASHGLVTRAMGQGRLPVFQSLAGQRPCPPLVTPFPPHTAPGWMSMFAGVSPGEHGVLQFWELQSPGHRPALTSVASVAREPLWRSLERHGLSVGLFHVPMTHPPAPIRGGYMITWPLTPSLNYAWPRSLIKELKQQRLHYTSDLMTMYRPETGYFEQACETLWQKTETLLYLLQTRPVDVVISVFTELDRVSHLYWGIAAGPGPKVDRIYDEVDVALGRLLQAIPQDTAVVIVSDHGFGRCTGNFNVNVALENAGLLQTRSAAQIVASRDNKPFSDVTEALSANWFRTGDSMREVDWENTRASMPAPGCYGISLNLEGRQNRGTVRPADKAQTLAEVADVIGRIELDGDRVFAAVPREAVYHGQRLRDAPDLILIPNRWDLMPAPYIGGDLFGPPTQAGIHRSDGRCHGQGGQSKGARGQERPVEGGNASFPALVQPLITALAARAMTISSLVGITMTRVVPVPISRAFRALASGSILMQSHSIPSQA